MIDQEPGIRRSVWSRSVCCFSKLDSGRRTRGDLESKCQCEQHVYKWGRLQGVELIIVGGRRQKLHGLTLGTSIIQSSWHWANTLSLFFFFLGGCTFLLYFFPLPFNPFMFSSLQHSPHCCMCPWVLFLFAQSLHTLPAPSTFPPILGCHPALYESVSILLVSSVCSLDSICEWNHMVFVFLWLAYFT